MDSQNVVLNQIGYGAQPGLLMFRPNVRRQHGYGLGAWFGRLWQRFVPFARKVIIPHTADAIGNVAQDWIDGKSVKDSLKANAMGVLKGVGNEVLNQKGSGSKRVNKRKRSTPHKKLTKRIKRVKKKFTKAAGKKSSSTTKKKKKKPLKKNNFLTLFD